MNILLLEAHELSSTSQAVIRGRRAQHIQQVLRGQQGQALRAGILGGRLGLAHVRKIEQTQVHIEFESLSDPPAPRPLKLVLALPRPKVLRRVLAHITTLGVKEIYLINAFRVEKPYWSSEQVREEEIRRACRLGLEQARDTILPHVFLEKLFKPFVEDRLPSIARGTRALVAHPGVDRPAPRDLPGPVTLAIGPEGGFIPFEIAHLEKAGFQSIHLGERILKFETAIPFLIGRLMAAVD